MPRTVVRLSAGRLNFSFADQVRFAVRWEGVGPTAVFHATLLTLALLARCAAVRWLDEAVGAGMSSGSVVLLLLPPTPCCPNRRRCDAPPRSARLPVAAGDVLPGWRKLDFRWRQAADHPQQRPQRGRGQCRCLVDCVARAACMPAERFLAGMQRATASSRRRVTASSRQRATASTSRNWRPAKARRLAPSCVACMPDTVSNVCLLVLSCSLQAMFDMLGLKSRPAFVDYPAGNESSRQFVAAGGWALGGGGALGGIQPLWASQKQLV